MAGVEIWGGGGGGGGAKAYILKSGGAMAPSAPTFVKSGEAEASPASPFPTALLTVCWRSWELLSSLVSPWLPGSVSC